MDMLYTTITLDLLQLWWRWLLWKSHERALVVVGEQKCLG
jgi:hypothetical protein